ncbi:hypothetical protein [Brevibacillus brevis]|uniref:Repressor Rok winged helix domain-containing protein n=1 Tax=Brevibacillus brevis TaxID=1393 RepID=A0ABY9TD92_BREBE|nr:hypothetical protein [Brevibacillus brevis]WNC17884.1 hypothetical protein RGB73_30410 [Brevibacillus brevis]
MLKELEALQESLKAAIERRVVLRRDYVDMDKQIGQEIKGYLSRIREIEESMLTDIKGQETIDSEIVSMDHNSSVDREDQRNRKSRYDYQQDVVPKVIQILRENGSKLKAKDIFPILKDKYDMEFSNRTITMNRVMALSPEITKEEGYYLLK